MPLRLNLCSGPRNVSTALMYAFAQRTDTHVVDEPLYAHYLQVTGAQHPGRDDILACMDSVGSRVVNQSLLGPCDRPILFVKNMGHHLVNLDLEFLNQMTTVMLIRDPEQMLPSLINQVPRPALADTALARQREVFDYLVKQGQTPCVLDAREILMNPEKVLRLLCERLGIAFEPPMLHWDKGGRPEDGVWAKHWYHVVHKSTGFAPYVHKSAPIPAFLRPLLDECVPHYQYLFQYVIKA